MPPRGYLFVEHIPSLFLPGTGYPFPEGQPMMGKLNLIFTNGWPDMHRTYFKYHFEISIINRNIAIYNGTH